MKQQFLNTKNAIAKLKKPSFEDFKNFNDRFSIIHDFTIRVAVIIGLSTLIFFFITEISSHKFVLTNIEVAHSIEENDKIYSIDLKQRVIRKIKKITYNVQNESLNDNNSESVSNENTALNVSGFDLNQVFLYFRNYFKLQNREITAYIMEGEKIGKKQYKYTVLLSIGHKVQEEKFYDSKDKIIEYLSEKILTYNTPYELGYFILKTKSKESKISNQQFNSITSHLDELCTNERFWEKTFHRNNWKWKKVYLEMMKFCFDNNVDVISSDFVKNPDKSICERTLCKIDSVNKIKNIFLQSVRDAVEKHTEDNLRTDSIQRIKKSQDDVQANRDSINRSLIKFHQYIK